MDTYRFIPAGQNDIEAVYEMERRLILQYEDPTVVDIQHALQWTRTKIEGNCEAFTQILCNDICVGYYHLIEQADLRIELDDFLILPAYRQQGIGTAVLQKIIKEAEDPVYLYVFQKNTKAVSLYTKAGFHTTKIISPTRMIMEYNRRKHTR